jgi:hypothetical protein
VWGQLGSQPLLAQQRATLAHASYIGLVQMLATQGDAALGDFKPSELSEALLRMLLAPAG